MEPIVISIPGALASDTNPNGQQFKLVFALPPGARRIRVRVLSVLTNFQPTQSTDTVLSGVATLIGFLSIPNNAGPVWMGRLRSNPNFNIVPTTQSLAAGASGDIDVDVSPGAASIDAFITLPDWAFLRSANNAAGYLICEVTR